MSPRTKTTAITQAVEFEGDRKRFRVKHGMTCRADGRQLKGDEYMKKRTLFTKLTLLCAGVLFFASCSMIDSAENAALKVETASASGQSSGQKFSFSGSICVTGALPASLCRADGDSVSSRSALPSVGETSLSQMDYYFVTATQTDGSGTFSINSFNNPSDFDTTNGVIFALSLGSGTWQIISGVKRSPTSSSVNANTDPIIMSDTYPATLSAANPVVNHTFYPKPSQSGSGLVGLSMTIPSTVSEVTTTCSNSNWRDNISVNVAGTSVTVMTKNMTSGGSTPSGSYEVTFNFFDEYGILLYSTVQTINVFDNMTTNTWVSDGSGVIGDSGEFSLTADLVSQFARTTFYVGQTAAATSVEVTASDITGSGSPYAPFETVTKAAEVIAATGDSSKDYRIFVSGTVTGAQEISDAVNGKANSITIQGYNGLDSNGEPKDALNGGFSWENQGTVLTVSSCTVPITIKNLKITGGCNSASGGGISIGGTGSSESQKANLTLESGALITENYIRPAISSGGIGINTFGAGIYMYYGKLTMKSGAVITKNKTLQNESVNMVYSSGAGIGLNTGTEFLMEDGEISENTAYGSGGAICMQSTNFATDISVAVRGGLISGNQCQQGNGGSIAYLYGNSLTIGGSAHIPYGGAEKSNDIYLAEGKTVTLTSPLTAHSATDQIAISPSEWTRGKTVVKADTNVPDLTPYEYYFKYTQDGWSSKVSTDNKSISIDMPIYVAGTEPERTVCAKDGSDETGDGTKGAPYATIAKAIELLTDKDTDYTIYIDGTISGAQTIPSTLTNTTSGTYKAQSLTIEGANGLDSSTQEPKDILDGNSSGSTLTVESNVPVTITKLKIIKGNGTEISSIKHGGGIYISDGASLALGDGALVTQNTASYGGGIYNLGKLFLYGTAMVGMQTNSVATSDNCGNKATEAGAGIFVSTEGQIYLGYSSWTSETENTPCELKGGVCGNYLSNTSSVMAAGGGIYTDGQLYIDSGNISYNYAINGAGIFTGSNITMTGGTIKGNEGNSSGYGGGVCVYNGKTFTMSGDSKILDNKNMNFGAGIYLYYNNCKLVMKGGEISGNIAATHGGAVYMHDYNSSNHSDMQISGSSYIPYGGAVNKNDIYMLDYNAKIKITDSLSDREANNLIYITPKENSPNTYTEGKTILEADNGVSLADEFLKFRVTPDSEGKKWSIDKNGNLALLTLTILTKQTLASFSPSFSTSYMIIVDSSFGTSEVNSLLSKISGKVGEGTIVDLGNSTATSISISGSLKSGVSSITLPATLSVFDKQFFETAYTLTEIIVPESNRIYCSQDGVLYTKDMTGLIKYPPAKEGDSFTLPETVYQLYYEAFYRNNNLKTINGLNQIKSFKDNESDSVFSNCVNLKEIDLSGLTCDTLGIYTIRSSSALEKVTLSSSITTIDKACFQTLSNLKEVHFKSTTPPLLKIYGTDGYYINFQSCPNVKFYVPSAAVSAYKNATGENGFCNPTYNGAATTQAGLQAKIVGE